MDRGKKEKSIYKLILYICFTFLAIKKIKTQILKNKDAIPKNIHIYGYTEINI